MAVALAVLVVVLAVGSTPAVASGMFHARAFLRSYEEVPAVSSLAFGEFRLRITGHDDSDDEEGEVDPNVAITWELRYRGLATHVRFAHIHFAQRGVNGAIIVTLPQLVSLEDASRGLNMFRTLEVPILGVIENMSYLDLPDGTRMDIFGSGGGQQLAQATETTFLGQIPIDQRVRIGGDSGRPIVVTDPESPVAQALTQIAQNVAARVSVAALGKDNSLPINIVE